MEKILLVAFAFPFFVISKTLYAQSSKETYDDSVYAMSNDNVEATKIVTDSLNDSNKDNVIYVDVPKRLNIKDKIFLINRSQCTILQAVIVLMNQGSYTVIGNASLINPGVKFEVVSYSDNGLKRLKGRTLGIKIKGVKKILGDVSNTRVDGGSFVTGSFNVNAQSQEFKSEEFNDIDPDLITYDFSVSLSETDHDLYITVASGTSAFDF